MREMALSETKREKVEEVVGGKGPTGKEKKKKKKKVLLNATPLYIVLRYLARPRAITREKNL